MDYSSEETSSEGDVRMKEKSDRQITECLLDIEEDLLQKEVLLDVITKADAEKVTPWALTVPYPKYIPQVPRKKPLKPVDDSALTYQHGFNSDMRHNNKLHRSFDSPDNFDLWKQCVEPTTYRYIPNNGGYRCAKVNTQQRSTVGNIKRAQPLEKYMSAEQRMLQREVHRALKREIEKHQELEKEKQKQHHENESSTEPKTKVDSDIRVKAKSPHSQGAKEVLAKDISRESPKLAKKKETKSKLHIQPGLPALDIPLVGKHMDELYMERFSKRISVLEEEMKKDMHVLRRNPEEIRSKSEPGHINVMSQHIFDLRDISINTQSLPEDESGTTKEESVKAKEKDQHSSSAAYKSETPVFGGNNRQDSFDKYRHPASNTAPSSVNYSKHNRNSSSDFSNDVHHHHHPPPYRTMSFENNMIQKAKIHRDLRLKNHYNVKEVSSPSTATAVKAVKVQPKIKAKRDIKSSVADSPATKVIASNFAAVPMGKSRHKDLETESFRRDLIPGVSGKRLQVSVLQHRLH